MLTRSKVIPASVPAAEPQRRLGRSNLVVSALGLGCWAIGGPWTFVDHPAGWGEVDDAESLRALRYALDAGVTLFDTAANYGCGHSERVLGQALAASGKRERVVIATKFGYDVDEERRVGRPRPADRIADGVQADCEASLRRLSTDYIDIYLLHVGCCDLASTARVRDALEGLVEEGKIRWYGWSTDDAEGASMFAEGPHCVAVEHLLNVANDAPRMLRVCEEYDLASINRSPLGAGLYTGKYAASSHFRADDLRSLWCLQEGWAAERLRCLEAAREALTWAGRTQVQGALGWIWARSERTIPIPGFKTVDQVRENVEALIYGPLPAEQVRRVDEVFGRSAGATCPGS